MALALDGFDSYAGGDPSSTGDAAVLNITTAGTNRVLYVCITATGFTLGVSGGGLTWTLRADGDPGGDTTAGRVFTAIAPAQLTAEPITVSFDSGTNFASIVLFGISGANTPSSFDPDPSLPNIQYPRGTIPDGGNGTITTSNANDFLIGFYISGFGGTSIDAPWTQIGSAPFMAVGYKIVSATQAAATIPATTGDQVGFIADAVVQQVAPGGARSILAFWMGGASAIPPIQTAAITESATASEAESATVVFAASRTEAATATDAQTAQVVFSASITEAATAGDSESTSAVYAASDSEAATALDAATAAATFSASLSETASASDAQSDTVDAVSSVTESASATDAADAFDQDTGLVTETANATDANSATAIMVASASEAASATDSVSAGNAMSASITEAATASEASSASIVHTASITEAAHATETQSSSVRSRISRVVTSILSSFAATVIRKTSALTGIGGSRGDTRID